MIDIIIGLVVIAILSLAIGYIVRAKRAGVKCIGCSMGGSCASSKPAREEGDGCSGGCSGCRSCGCGH